MGFRTAGATAIGIIALAAEVKLVRAVYDESVSGDGESDR